MDGTMSSFFFVIDVNTHGISIVNSFTFDVSRWLMMMFFYQLPSYHYVLHTIAK